MFYSYMYLLLAALWPKASVVDGLLGELSSVSLLFISFYKNIFSLSA